MEKITPYNVAKAQPTAPLTLICVFLNWQQKRTQLSWICPPLPLHGRRPAPCYLYVARTHRRSV